MKPRVFIGSSREGLPKAKLLKGYLSGVADCQIWNEDFFENNKSSFESLSQSSTLFDFAILLASADDVVLKRDNLEISARDNVLFEFGLYVGRLGRNRAFFVKEKGLNLPSDLYGITLSEFDFGSNFEDVSNGIGKRIVDLWQTFELGLAPSTILALGYFDNFVLPVSRELMQSEKRSVEGLNFADFTLNIVIPDELPNNFQDEVIAYLGTHNLKEMKVETVTRKFNFYLDYDYANQESLNLYDLPTTLGALKRAIEMAVPNSYYGESERERVFKKKEMNNFCRALTYLVGNNSITKKKVKITMVDV
ncbi:STING domain-containing protein [Dyadobacter fermentans]|uniref:CD-NTase-associated protein 12 n=1 Tax=Dyadobacter fermentans (strain ATCC 700827 / DSM 18053 / CIP 107007 / KCTC 52180 / NS114) TaxID=471854 RepID=C6W705_DYAFD|nr:STING domain-containing protein [Dyadobacter fermentans]ACT92614.1 nucleotide-binding protein containing TIR -like domain-like protein [Dyadobacter fermentans DSM 18053]